MKYYTKIGVVALGVTPTNSTKSRGTGLACLQQHNNIDDKTAAKRAVCTAIWKH
jgi:hypothetical protein